MASFYISDANKRRLDAFLAGEHNKRSVEFKVEQHAGGRVDFNVMLAGYIDPYNEHGKKQFCFNVGRSLSSLTEAVDLAFKNLRIEDRSHEPPVRIREKS